jgi:hypothetical protein
MGVLQSIREGKYDRLLTQITMAVADRKIARLVDLHVGSKVRISRQARPAYIAGRIGTIKEFRRSRILVILDNGAEGTRFARGILCRPEGLEPVE